MADDSPTLSSDSTGRIDLSVEGMSCSNCVRHVTDALQQLPGVASAVVSLETRRAVVRVKPGAEVEVKSLVAAVERAGYAATMRESSSAGAEAESHAHEGTWGINVLTGIVPTALLMAGEWLLRFGEVAWWRWTSAALACVVQFGPGRHFYRGAWNQLKVGSSNMDTLVALGSTTAFAYSAWGLLIGAAGHLYFMEAAAIITLISVGHWMEARASSRASSALRALMNLAPALARRRNPDGTESEVPVSNLSSNDAAILKPGDRIPTDGEIVEG